MKFNKLLEESQFHGGRRLAEGKCRWCWSIAMLTLFGSAVTVICITVWRFLENPTFMVMIETVQDFKQFPSVLVCPEISFRDDKIDRFLSHVEIPPNLNYTYLKQVMFMLGAFWSPDIQYEAQDLQNIERLLEFNDMDVETAGRLLTTSCESTLLRCRWQSVTVNCSSLFQMELTGDGFCCVFNGRSLSRELNNMHQNTSRKKWYTDTFGFTSGLVIAVNQSQTPSDVDLSYKWLALQNAEHYVESSINGSALNPGSEQWVEYHTRYFQIADEARSLSNSLKKCRMAYEPLKFFPIYHKKYCIVECEIAQTLRRCNCVRLVHPRPEGASYCNARHLLCAKGAMVSFDSGDCDCPRACDAASNFVKISSTFNLLEGMAPVDDFYDGLDLKKVTVARIFVQNRKAKINSRSSYFNNTDLFAQLGGVFNVFFGCSILTLLELCIMTFRGIISKIPANVQAEDEPQNNQEFKDKESKKIGTVKTKKLKLEM